MPQISSTLQEFESKIFDSIRPCCGQDLSLHRSILHMFDMLFCEDCEGECLQSLHHVCASSAAMMTGAYWSNCPDLYRFSSFGNDTSTCFHVHKRRLLMHVRHGFCHRTFLEPFACNWNLRAAQHGTWGLLSAIVVQSNTPPDAQTWRRWRRSHSRCSEHGRIEVHPLQKVPNLVVQ